MNDLLFRGWIRAVASAVAVVVCVVALGEAVSFVLYASKVLPHETAAQAARQGLIFFYLFHGVPIRLDTPALQLPLQINSLLGLPTGYEVNASVVFGMLTGTVLAVWLFARAGRSIAGRIGGTPAERAIHGAKLAIPYAVITAVGSRYVKLVEAFPRTSSLTVEPSHFGSILAPLFLAMAFAAYGGIRSTGRAEANDWLQWKLSTKWRLRWNGAFRGAATMLVLSLGLSLVGLLVVAAFNPGATTAFFRALAGHKGFLGGLAGALVIGLALPNIAAWTLLPAMGGCLEIGGGGTANAAPAPYCFLSYGNSPAHSLGSPNPDWAFLGLHQLGTGSAWLFLFLLVPLVAAVVGGMRAVRTARANTTREAIIVTALTATVFAIFMILVYMMSWLTIETNGAIASAEGYIRFGPYPADAVQLAFGWALIAGGAGAFWMKRRLKNAG